MRNNPRISVFDDPAARYLNAALRDLSVGQFSVPVFNDSCYDDRAIENLFDVAIRKARRRHVRG